MTILRPVTQLAPATSKVLEDTSLPFSFVITPLGDRAELPSPYASASSSSSSSSGQNQPSDAADTHDNEPIPLPVPAALVAKCTHCGSPSNPCSPCIDSSAQLYLCGLCGKTYGADAASQHSARKRADWSSSAGVAATAATAAGQHADVSLMWKEAYHERRRKSTLGERSRAGVTGGLRRGGDDEVGADVATKRHAYELSLPVVPIVGSAASTNSSGSAQYPSSYAIPARLCPPILLFLVDGTSYDQSYYDAVCRSIYKAIENAPEYARVGIFVATEGGGMSVFDLGGSVPHLKHCRVPIRCGSSDDTGRGILGRLSRTSSSGTLVPLIDVADLIDTIVPLCSYHKSHVDAAIRALGDMTTVIGGACRHRGGGYGQPSMRSGISAKEGIHLGASLEALLDYLEDGMAYHPDLLDKSGQVSGSTGSTDDWSICVDPDLEQEGGSAFRYAGGKVMCFLSGAPTEIPTHSSTNFTGTIGTGGFGGCCAEIGRRFAVESAGSENEASESAFETQDTDFIDPETGLAERDVELNGDPDTHQRRDFGRSGLRNADLYFNGLGVRCAEAALGVELFVLGNFESESERSYIGLPILRLLSDRSGASGPLLVGVGAYAECSSEVDSSNCVESSIGGTVGALLREVSARCPWGRPIAFGTMLRLRMTPSLRIDSSPAEQHTKHHYEGERLASLHESNGFFGPLSSSSESDLVVAATCDNVSSFTFDVDVVSKSGKANERIYLEGRGEVEMNACIQSCFAYTSILRSGDDFITVRRLRVLSTNMKMSDNTEDILSSLDAEALAVVLFHKLSQSSMQDGLEETQHVAQDWLLSTLLCTYRSAEAYYEKIKAEAEHGISRSRKTFYSTERLMGQKGSELTDRDVLLARGHERLSSLPLLVFSLLQCDALRPSGDSFRPTIDSRAAAAANMARMSPGALARCIAPRLELWLEHATRGGNIRSGKGEPLVESLNMNMEALRLAFFDLRDDAQQESKYSPILLLDSPRQVVICDCSFVVDRIDGRASTRRTIADSDHITKVGPVLHRAIQETLRSYRVPPPVLYCLGDNNTGCMNEAILHLQDALVEDSYTSLSRENFDQWCTEVASLLHSEVAGK